MEQHKLPNVTIALVLSIISFIACCCSSGLGGLILSGIALFLVNKDEKEYLKNPENYSNYGQLKTTKTVAYIGLVLAILSVVWVIYSISSMGGWDAYMENQQKVIEGIMNQTN